MHGGTIYSTLSIPITNGGKFDLNKIHLKQQQLQERLQGIRYVIIDKKSMVGRRMLGLVDMRLKQAFPEKKWIKIDIGNSEFAAGLTFVALSRVHSLENICFKQFTFDRLQRIKRCKRLQERKVEEERLRSMILPWHMQKKGGLFHFLFIKFICKILVLFIIYWLKLIKNMWFLSIVMCICYGFVCWITVSS